MRHIRFVVLALLTAATWNLSACSGCSDDGQMPSDVADVLPDEGDVAGDVDVEPELPADVPEEDIDVPDEIEPEEVPQPEPAVSFCVLTAQGCLEGADLALTLADHDLYADEANPGLQVDMLVTTSDIPMGTKAELWIDGVLQKPTVNIPAAQFTFSKKTITHAVAPNCHEVEVRIPNVVSDQKTVCADTGMCGVAVEPTTEFCLTQDADEAAGFQYEISVSNDGTDCTQAWIDGDVAALEPVELVDGKATFLVSFTTEDGALNCAEPLMVVHVGDPAVPEREQTLEVVYTVDNETPAVTIDAPAGATLNLADDEDGDPSNGLQTTILGTVTGSGPDDVIEVWIDGNLAYTTTAVGNDYMVAGATIEATGLHEIEVRTTDCCGGTGSAVKDVLVILGYSDLTVLSPLDGSCLPAADDGNAATLTAYETQFLVQAPEAQTGSTIGIECRPDQSGSVWSNVAELSVDAPAEDFIYTIEVALDVTKLTRKMLCRASLTDGVVKVSPLVGIVAAIPAPALTIDDPLDGALLDPATATVSGSAFGLDGQTVTASLLEGNNLLVQKQGVVSGGGYSIELAPLTIPDDQYTLRVEAADAFCNEISGPAAPSIGVVLDSEAPTLVYLDPLDGTVCAPPACADTIGVIPGHQIEIAIEVLGEPFPEQVEVCLSLNGYPMLPCVAPVEENGTWVAHFFGATLLSGINVLSASAEDALGHKAENVNANVELEDDSPRVAFAFPTTDLVVGAEPIDVQMLVTTADLSSPIETAVVTMYVGGNALPTLNLGVNGLYSFSVTGLTPDTATTLQASALYLGKTGWSDVRKVTLKTTAPSIDLGGVTDGQVVNLASTFCAKGVAGCKLSLTAATTNAEPGAQAKLNVDCGGGPTTYSATVKADIALFPGVLLSDNSTCVLQASVTDLAGQEASDAPVSVTVDRTAPVVAYFVSPPYAIMPKVSDEAPAVNGYQSTVSVAVGGLEAGQTVTLDVVPAEGLADQLQAVLAETVEDGKVATIGFGQYTFEQGAYNLSVGVADLAGNPGTLSKDFQFLLEEMEVRFDPGSYLSEDPCTSNAECSPGICVPVLAGMRCAIPWKASPQTLALFTQPTALFDGAQNLRLCSSNPGYAGTAEVCATNVGDVHYVAKQVNHAGGFEVLSFTQTEVTKMPQGLHHVFIEAQRNDTLGWVPSTSSSFFSGRDRYVMVDGVAPVVDSVAFPEDTKPPLGVLNLSEVAPGASVKVSATVGGADGGTATFTANGADKGTFPVAGGQVVATIKLNPGANDVCVTAKDDVGNASAKKCASVTLDAEAPSLSFTYPDYSPLLSGSSPDATLLSNLPGGTVHLERNIGGNWTEQATALVSPLGVAAFVGALAADGSYELRAWIKDSAENQTTAYTTPAVILVDRTGPTVTLQDPADGKAYQPADDLNGAQPGFKVAVTFQALEAVSWKIEAIRCPDNTFTGCQAPVDKTPGPADISDLGNSTYKVNITFASLFNPVEYRIVKVTATDASGNQSVDSANVSLTVGACAVEFLDLPETDYIGNVFCPVTGQNCGATNVPLSVGFGGGCGGVDQVALYIDDVPAKITTEVGGGKAAFTVPVTDGVAIQLEARLYSQGVDLGFGTAIRAFVVDLQDPAPVYTAPASDPFICNVAADLNKAAADCQTNVAAAISGNNLVGGTVELLRSQGDVEVSLASVPMTAEPFNAAFNNVTLPAGAGQKLILRAADAAGNVAQGAVQADVDVVAPAAVALDPIDPATDINRRRPSVKLTWAAVADDASAAASGNATEYQVRYSTAPITSDATFEAACDSIDIAGAPNTPLPGAAGAAELYEISGPDVRGPTDPCRFVMGVSPGTTWYFAVRALDELGNAGTVTQAGAVSTGGLNLLYSKLAAGTFGLTMGSRVFALGDINGDGMAEYAVGGDATYNGFCIVRGHTGTEAELTLSGNSPNIHCISDTFASVQGYYVTGIGDVNGDGFRDVASGVFADSLGNFLTEYRVHLGNASGFVGDTPRLRIIIGGGFYSASALSGAGNFTGDTTAGGKPIGDILVSYPEQNRVFLIPGSATWNAGAGTTTIDLTKQADLDTWMVQVFQGSGMPADAQFGNTSNGVGNVLIDGDGTGTQYDDVAMARQKAPGGVFVVKGRAVTQHHVLTVSDGLTGAGTEDLVSVKLQPEAFLANVDWFGGEIEGRGDIDGDNVPEIMVAHPYYAAYSTSQVYIFFGSAVNAALGSTVVLQAQPNAGGQGIDKSAKGLRVNGNFFNGTFAGNFDLSTGVQQSGSIDLAYGDFNGQSTWGKVYVRLNLLGLSIDGNIYPSLDLTIQDPFDPGNPKFGAWEIVSLGDTNGDSMPELLVATDGLGYAVLVY